MAVCFSELEEAPALPRVKVLSNLCAFCFHWSGICQNYQKSLEESVIIRYLFTACTFIRKLYGSKGRKTVLSAYYNFCCISYNLLLKRF